MEFYSGVPTILKEILDKKQKVVLRTNTRTTPLNPPNLDSSLIIAEIKRASPSAGNIGEIANPNALAKAYLQGGAGAISVLCEQDYFKGDLEDLKRVKESNPKACVLRKDFITKIEQIAESYAFGADMVLLIAAVFVGENNPYGGFLQLKKLYLECLEFGLTPLVEVHNAQEVEFITPLNAKLIGINSRNLHTFIIDRIQAYNLLGEIQTKNPQSKVIFESSLNCDFDGFVVGNLGFDGILCGSYLVRNSEPKNALTSLKESLECGKKDSNIFYKNVFRLLDSPLGFVKICGITNTQDALMCAQGLQELDKDSNQAQKIAALGFIIEPKSPRFIEIERIRAIAKELERFPNILKVVVLKDDKNQMQSALKLYQDGIIDALQLHGIKRAGWFGGVELRGAKFAFYEAWNVENAEDLGEFVSPFVLLDSKSILGGGSGQRIGLEVLEQLKSRVQTLCVAGGVGIENLESLKKLGAKMLDINSSIESKVGKKDLAKLQSLIAHLKNFNS
ncbi:bifunctional indole-3-glycerol phosphate synthase/phosphoribosylanthranilate isomerase [Helicobacter sp. MIT 11-5569]|uniref:bifunctional indole-3-glycerol phosphate synthase/phosphoribosylanthranilate isomerase n=1 Tax=Helicobacter sp. MIT 11-5569 TaxID=1548151 RepID=UPI00051FD979|nr:bifunctional indole-3-glycerol phosphate synthase/phosphoribosylanthranilate isomerase [Helicobacter sp. MIT 11-5569]TLD85200.1 bifunctional indole-3-glycerol phosphate synthase/phosphoribosylanthranilate isomerase [Helicobacter sp. MIT 11-5569]